MAPRYMYCKSKSVQACLASISTSSWQPSMATHTRTHRQLVGEQCSLCVRRGGGGGGHWSTTSSPSPPRCAPQRHHPAGGQHGAPRAALKTGFSNWRECHNTRLCVCATTRLGNMALLRIYMYICTRNARTRIYTSTCD